LNEKIICIGHITALPKTHVAHLGEVGISVLKEFWGIGVGTRLMSEVIRVARESGALEALHLGVKADNEPAISLYRKYGFCETGRFPGFFKINGQYFDEINMILNL